MIHRYSIASRMKKNSSIRRLVVSVVCGSLMLSTAAARAADKPVRIKLATIVPSGTSYHKSLLKMRDKWRQVSGGAVDVVVYEGNKAGGETETVGLMQADQLQASLLSAVGLAEIEPAVAGLQNLPMAFKTLDEVDYVGEKLRPMLEKRLLEKGFVVLFWTDAGWVRFFSTKPVVRPDDLRKLKVFSWAGNAAQVEIYKAAGINPVPLETADVVPGFTTGLIEAIPMPPYFVLGAQIDNKARHMLNLNWAPLVGALVVTKKAWDRIPEASKTALQAAAAEAGKENKVAGRSDSEESVKRMQQRGLTVHEITPEIEAEWLKTIDSVKHILRGKIVPPDIYDEAMRLIQEYRVKNAPSR